MSASRTLTTQEIDQVSSTSPVTTTTTAYTMLSSDRAIVFNAAATTATITLLSASLHPGRPLRVKTVTTCTLISSTSNVVPITSTTAGTAILGATTGAWAELISNGSNWITMAKG